MSSENFYFLADRWPPLAQVAATAERNTYQDPNTCISKFRLFAETMAKYITAFEEVDEPYGMTQVDRLRLLYQEQILPQSICDLFHLLRKTGNKAAHEPLYGTIEEAKLIHHTSFQLAVWYMEVYGDWDFQAPPYQAPVENQVVDQSELEQLTEDYEAKIASIESELQHIRTQQVDIHDKVKKQRRKNSQYFAEHIQLTEKQTRKLIDQQLENHGWEADSETIRFSKGVRPEHGKNKAIAEWPLQNRYADYALFIGTKLVGLVEAKKESKDVMSDIEQVKDNARRVQQVAEEKIFEPWNDLYVPFLFATNGRPYHKQWEQKSGVWFLDGRKTTNHSKPLQGWYTPEGLEKLLQQDTDRAERQLAEETFDYLQLRDYQVKAIKAVEHAIQHQKREILIGMATGTGKTRMAIGLIYRLIKSGRFRRVLFLVDRTALGEQAEATFKASKLENASTFYEIYNLQSLTDKSPERETKVQIATVQGMLRKVFTQGESQATVDQYDCIVVDEAHRGYTLDRDMSDFEMEFRDQHDYVSKYRQVLDYFDAVKIGLTATPALHTREIFGDPVFNYTYREAVVEGYLIDHEPPIQFETALKKNGITWEKGANVDVFDTKTRSIKQELLEDEVSIEVTQFNTKVVTENFNQVIINELVQYISPDDDGKTLIFAATDDHADLVVRLLKSAFDDLYGEVEDQAIMKITGSIDNPSMAIRRFKNERYPNMVVTVDLLTTGIDVPEITNLVFLRRVRSRILYEQMLGRATRRCEHIAKDHFIVFDAVGLYEALAPYSDMKPVVVSPQTSLLQLTEELNRMSKEEDIENQVEQIIGKLQRKKQGMSDQGAAHFQKLADDKEIGTLIEELQDSTPQEAIDKINRILPAFQYLDENLHRNHKQFISHHQDELLNVTRGYGKAEKPDDYLQSFEQYIKDHMNEIPALSVVCQRPTDLTREELKQLRLVLEKEGYTEKNLQTAWRESRNQDIAADIIAFIRQLALGDPLISHEERIRQTMKKIYEQKAWPVQQKKWLERMEKQLIKESLLHPEPKHAFDAEPFIEYGGYERLNKIFKGQLPAIVEEINANLYKIE
ncbi:type I restriction-modification system endonuclease [Gracilibacillus alcaliphilus]|uniref:type I restriction-modification system endonuclease n=1 Tax=Gracilibacillus alcaliphilus TaxID=1401441 RepID=UPI0019579A38|nr:type I restriction-modification system endonuclease [Gracilibacillus alcaliphilus]MBM7676567.1 type I restriction enzyme R subunit [Gracilibacillus alcaliphilus]